MTAIALSTRAAVEGRPHLASLVEEWRRNGRDRAIVAHRGVRAFGTTYAQLAQLAGRFAAELERRGIGAGDRVVLWGENSAEWIAAFFGCALRGVLAVPLDAAGSAEFASRIVAEVTPRLVVGDARLLEQIQAPDALNLADLPETMPPKPSFEVYPGLGLESPLQIVFTSGTTSEPRGVVHTHRNVLVSVTPIEREIRRYLRYERPFHPLRFLHTLPLSHVFGQFMGMWLPPLLSAEVHFIDSVEPSRLLTTLKRERISVLVAVPRILELLRSDLLQRFPQLGQQLAKSQGWPAWKRWWRFRRVHRLLGWKFWALICGGATLPADLESFWNGLGLALVQGYGMTETAALVTLNHPFHVGQGTLGKALPGREVRLNAEGEIEVRGDMLASGTWRNGQLQPRAGEWLATGDLGEQEPSGELRFVGRKGDVIVTAAGLNLHPQDLEAALLAQPGVRGCAVVACETAQGQEPIAAVLFEGSEDQMRAATELANRQLAAFQQLRHVLRWPEPSFPYTSTGKLLRRRIAAWACARIAPAHNGAGRTEQSDPLLTLIAEITHEPIQSESRDLRLTEDLHLDSLGRVQLQSALEARFGVDLSDDAMASIATLGELRSQLEHNPEQASEQPPEGDPGALAGPVAVNRTIPGPPATIVSNRPAAVAGAKRRNDRIAYSRWPWSAPVRWLRSCFIELIARPLVRVLAAPRVVRSGSAVLPQPLLIIANHVNTYDMPLILYALPGPIRRRVAAAMSAEVLGDLQGGRGQGNALLNLLARPAAWLLVVLFNVFPLPRLRGFRRSFAHAGEALDRGYSVLIFPEGRRGETGVLQPFRPGIGLLVQAARVPVLPVALQGMGTAKRQDRGWFRSGAISVHVGEPVTLPATMSPEEITRRLEDALRELNPS